MTSNYPYKLAFNATWRLRNYGWQRWNQIIGTIFRITIYCNACPLTQSAESLMITSNADYIRRRKINLFGQHSTTPSSNDSRITGIGSFCCFFFGYCERLRVLGRVVTDQFYFSLANPVHLLLQFLVNHNIRLSVDKVWSRTQFLFVASILNRCINCKSRHNCIMHKTVTVWRLNFIHFFNQGLTTEMVAFSLMCFFRLHYSNKGNETGLKQKAAWVPKIK